MSDKNKQSKQPISQHDIKQNSGVSASMALQATQKAWDLRQAANAAGDPNAREEILAKAINKEIEAESFGKAAKYTQSGAFQGLAAGAGLGVQPGVTLGKLTGAIVGGTVSTVTGLLGGGIGSVYGSMSGPMWDLGQMASHGVRGVVGDFPNWSSTPSQKKALEKMVMQSKETQAPTNEELEKMKAEAPDGMPQSWSESAKDMTSHLPSMPSLASMPSMSKAGSALGLGGVGAAMGLGGSAGGSGTKNQVRATEQSPKAGTSQNKRRSQAPKQQTAERSKPSQAGSEQRIVPSKNQTSRQGPSKPRTNPIRTQSWQEVVQKRAGKVDDEHNSHHSPKTDSAQHSLVRAEDAPSTKTRPPKLNNNSHHSTQMAALTKQSAASRPKRPSSQPRGGAQANPDPETTRKPTRIRQMEGESSITNNDVRSSAEVGAQQRKPRKLNPKTKKVGSEIARPAKKKPRKLQRGKTAV
ncbi:hypothetical protein K461DRAFT_274497 [Myriangium duriaei CBS 260.36]|uniref:Uncharacterized protein n=1 Tax=Myriangium duriaei CBS 260.36 TaxID=1168546 RepID=A0A9P4J9A7_9PEZI|nr:hypothetical protein K461DRAFT_274497 [Myriangium duriaei CBS 260.36]